MFERFADKSATIRFFILFMYGRVVRRNYWHIKREATRKNGSASPRHKNRNEGTDFLALTLIFNSLIVATQCLSIFQKFEIVKAWTGAGKIK